MNIDSRLLGDRLRMEREARGWSVPELARRLDKAGAVTSTPSMERTIRRWESGRSVPGGRHQMLLAQVYGIGVLQLFAPAAVEADTDPLELVDRLRRSDLADSDLDAIGEQVDVLCTRYSTDPPAQLRVEAGLWLGEVTRAAEGRTTLRQAGELIGHATWLTLLLGCLANDVGDRTRAEAARVRAGHLAADIGNGRAVAWSHEMSAWFGLTDGELRAAVRATDAGLDASDRSDVSVQLLGQRAEALARLGDHHGARVALDEARTVLDALAWPERPLNHFTVDPPKYRKTVMRVSRLLGDHATADTEALQIIREGSRPDGSHRQPMRVADARASMAATAAAAGEVDRAVALAHQALDVERISVPSLLLVVGEAVDLLPVGNQAVAGLVERARALAA